MIRSIIVDLILRIAVLKINTIVCRINTRRFQKGINLKKIKSGEVTVKLPHPSAMPKGDTEPLSTRIPSSVRSFLEKEAKAADLSLSSLTANVLVAYAKALGYKVET